MWRIIIGLFLSVFAAGYVYISFRTAKSGFVMKLAGGRRWLARLLCVLFYALLTVILSLLLNLMNALVCILHFVLFRLICDFIGVIIIKISRKKPRVHLSGVIAAVLCAVYLTAGWFAANDVRQTEYKFVTEKINSNIRIVQITDSHLGTTLGANEFLKQIEKINKLKPDIVVVTGDFVDDSTSRADMAGGCAALGKLKTKYGVYFVYGNHDKGYASEELKGWKNSEMRLALEQNGVITLEDEYLLIDKSFYVVGRKDRSEEQLGGNRKSVSALLETLDKDKYIILLDHQPHDFDAEAQAGADLVLCGHTHGGQFIPINHIGELIGENCLRYGHEKRQNTDFIVSSGISSWAFKFKTGCFSEYTVIDIKSEK